MRKFLIIIYSFTSGANSVGVLYALEKGNYYFVGYAFSVSVFFLWIAIAKTSTIVPKSTKEE